MAESRGTVVQDSDIYHDFACTVCAENDRNVEALKRCDECAENLCGECLRNHNMFKAMRRHTLVDKADVGKGQSCGPGAALTAVPNVKCESHPGNRIELYCGDHDEVGCPTCTGLNHKLCEDMYYIPAVAPGYKNTREPLAIAESLGKLVRRTKQIKQREEDTLKQLTDEMNAAVELIDNRAERIQTRVYQLKDKAIKDVKDTFKESQQSVKASISKSKDVLVKLEAEEEKLDDALKTNESELFIYSKQGKKMQEDNAKSVQELETSIVHESFKVIVDDTALELVTKLETFAVAKSVRGPSHKISVKASPYVKQNVAKQPEEKKDTNAYESLNIFRYKPNLSFSLDKKPNVRTDKDQDICSIVNCCAMDNGDLAMTDSSNRCLKLFNKSYTLLDRKKFQEQPFALCAVDDELAVTLCQRKSVQFAKITVNKKIQLTHSFSIGEVCRGMTYSNKRLYLSCGGETSSGERPGHVSVYDIDGQLLQTIKPTIPQLYTLSMPLSLSVGPNANCVVANRKKGVLAFDRNGRAIWHYEHDNLKWATGLIEIDDKVIVCCYTTGNVIEISTARLTSRILIHGSGVMTEPRSLFYSKHSGKLYVAKTNCDHINVYRRQ